jgi:hypothetical protein
MDMDKTSIGQTYNLAGPKTYTNREFLQLVADTLADPNHSRMTVNVPKPIMQAIHLVADDGPGPHREEVRRRAERPEDHALCQRRINFGRELEGVGYRAGYARGQHRSVHQMDEVSPLPPCGLNAISC